MLVAGGISYWSWSGDWPSLADLRGSIEEEAAIMAKAGADLLMLEMMVDIDRMLVTLEAAQAERPAGLGRPELRTGRLRRHGLSARRPPGRRARGDRGRSVPLVSIMHTEVEHIDACLDIVADHWQGPVGVYAHSARWVDHKCIFDVRFRRKTMRRTAKRWLERGVQVIGGCCGMRVDHITALQELV